MALCSATGMGYAEAVRRMHMVGQALVACADLVPGLSEAAESEPLHRTHRVVNDFVLLIHGFSKTDGTVCFCQDRGPFVAVGVTDDGSMHIAAVVNGEISGAYDATEYDFNITDVWKLDLELFRKMSEINERDFRAPNKLNQRVRRMIKGNV